MQLSNLGSFIFVFLEGIMAFISPCILPMFPVYLFYLAGETQPQPHPQAKASENPERGEMVLQSEDQVQAREGRKKLVINTLGFIMGFTIIFVILGASATLVGTFISYNKLLIQRVSGIIIILFGLYYTGLLKIPFLDRERRFLMKPTGLGFFSSLLFGAAFSFGWTPCLGPFLGTAFLLAANKETLQDGILMLFVFSMGLGVPFLVSALLFHQLMGFFNKIKQHFAVIKTVSGVILMIAGLSLLFNFFGYWAGLFS